MGRNTVPGQQSRPSLLPENGGYRQEGETLARRLGWWRVRCPGLDTWTLHNGAERSIRPGVLWRKGSVGTQSVAGSRFVERMMTVVST